MNEEARKKVSNYLNLVDVKTNNLQFGNYLTETPIDFSKDFSSKNLRELIILCINLAQNHCSIDSNGEFETYPNRHRSVLDIWRHIKNYRPEFTIFDVMSEIYKMGMENILVGHICSTILRRVFELYEQHSDWELLHQEFKDEFGIRFETWNNI